MPMASFSTVAFVAVVDLARQLLTRGLVCQQQLQAIDVDLPIWVATLVDSGADQSWLYRTLPEHYLLQLWQLAEDSASPCLGFELGADVNPAAQGILAYRIQHSDTLAGALNTFRQHIALMNPAECWQVEKSGQRLTLSLHCPPRYSTMAQQRSLVAMVAWANHLACDAMQPLAWHLPAADCTAVNRAWLQAFADCPIEPAQQYGLSIEPGVLDRALVRADRFLAAMLEQEIQALNTPTMTVRQQVERLLHQDLPRYSKVEVVAQQLALSRTRLYRQLKQEGVQFRQLLEQQRTRLWHKWRQRVDAISLAERLGFTDVSSFYKAQRRWQAAALEKDIDD